MYFISIDTLPYMKLVDQLGLFYTNTYYSRGIGSNFTGNNTLILRSKLKLLLQISAELQKLYATKFNKQINGHIG